ncbi:mitochondrial import receptor subunit TOM20 homolog [Galendromus occidentalis]|uniref:Mitochondrial import receptor subunit TOM20 homolog n=1 Tax=Galendromus occidentalis TaxID=34638 RepID=A0AAJ6QNP7_9ACAR|nr:mitochondrial import receptor subunit TOM20 homolog [Galendromus occidentalis]
MLNGTSNTALVAAGIAGTLFIGYCIYFDKKRRSDPMYKQRVRERRLRDSKAKKRGTIIAPDFKDVEAVQKFFFQEMQIGEELLSQGEIESALEHLAAAVAVCGQPHQLLQVLKQSIPAPIYNQLVKKIPAVTQQLSAHMEEDVE